MIHEETFKISLRPYAVDLNTLQTATHDRKDGSHFYSGVIDAVWFRRKKGATVACLGSLWDYQDELPVSALAFLEHHADGRYGGSWIARWDGESYASEIPKSPEETAAHLAVLVPMLKNYPAIPPGYHGWWMF